MSKVALVKVEELRPHPLHGELYGPPTANDAYQNIRADMKRRGYDQTQPLLVTKDQRIIRGRTRWAAAKSAGLAEVPCTVFVPESEATAELEYEREIVRGNAYRTKTELMKAREQRKLLEVEKALGLRRMAEGSDGGPSKSTARVGKMFGESHKTVERRLKVLDAIEEAQGAGNEKRAEVLAGLLESKKITDALELAKTPEKKAAAPKREAGDAPGLTLADLPKGYVNMLIDLWSATCVRLSEEHRELAQRFLRQMGGAKDRDEIHRRLEEAFHAERVGRDESPFVPQQAAAAPDGDGDPGPAAGKRGKGK
jgi:ParB-like chromosome segregation protein Spo0J